MEEILKSITEAEEKAREIISDAEEKALKIEQKAESEAAEILKTCAADCKVYRENAIKKAEKDGQISYGEALSHKRAEVSAYAEEVLKDSGSTVAEIVRRITRGSC